MLGSSLVRLRSLSIGRMLVRRSRLLASSSTIASRAGDGVIGWSIRTALA